MSKKMQTHFLCSCYHLFIKTRAKLEFTQIWCWNALSAGTLCIYDDLNKNDSHRLIHMNACLTGIGIIWEGLVVVIIKKLGIRIKQTNQKEKQIDSSFFPHSSDSIKELWKCLNVVLFVYIYSVHIIHYM